MALVYIFIPIIFIPLVVYEIGRSIDIKKQVSSLRESLKTNNFSISHEIESCFIDAARKKVCFYESQEGKVKYWVLNYLDVLGTTILKDNETLHKTANGSVIGRAIVGGVILGGVGAIIGGLTASSNTNVKIKKIVLEVVLNCPDHPVHRIYFLNNLEGISENSITIKDAVKKLEFGQTLIELMMMNEDIPNVKNTVDFSDTLRMIKLKNQRGL